MFICFFLFFRGMKVTRQMNTSDLSRTDYLRLYHNVSRLLGKSLIPAYSRAFWRFIEMSLMCMYICNVMHIVCIKWWNAHLVLGILCSLPTLEKGSLDPMSHLRLWMSLLRCATTYESLTVLGFKKWGYPLHWDSILQFKCNLQHLHISNLVCFLTKIRYYRLSTGVLTDRFIRSVYMYIYVRNEHTVFHAV